MNSHYAFLKKSCTSSTGYVPVKSTGHKMFDAPLYLMQVAKYRTTIQAQCVYTLSKGGKHVSSLFQDKNGPKNLFYGDIFSSGDALLFFMDGLTMEIFLFEGQRNFAEAFYRNTEKLPLPEIRLKARPVHREKYERQLLCYQDKQLTII